MAGGGNDEMFLKNDTGSMYQSSSQIRKFFIGSLLIALKSVPNNSKKYLNKSRIYIP